MGLSYWGSRDRYGGPNTAGDNGKNSNVYNQTTDTGFDAYDLKLGYGFSGYTLSSSTSYLKLSYGAHIDSPPCRAVFRQRFPPTSIQTYSRRKSFWNSPSEGDWRWSVGGNVPSRHRRTDFSILTVLGTANAGSGCRLY